jgi:hypothetical protein
MRLLRGVAVAALVGSTGCANVWGFAELTSEEHDSGLDGSSGDADGTGDAGGADSPFDLDTGVTSGSDAAGCRLSNATSCRGKCPGDASPCGCLAEPASGTLYCGPTGGGVQGSNCSGDTDCAPGYGCQSATMQCSHWCPPTTACAAGTTCHDAGLFYGGATYGYCY